MNIVKKRALPLLALNAATITLASCSAEGNERNARYITENFPVLSMLFVIAGIGVILYGLLSNLNTPMAILIGAALIVMAIILF